MEYLRGEPSNHAFSLVVDSSIRPTNAAEAAEGNPFANGILHGETCCVLRTEPYTKHHDVGSVSTIGNASRRPLIFNSPFFYLAYPVAQGLTFKTNATHTV